MELASFIDGKDEEEAAMALCIGANSAESAITMGKVAEFFSRQDKQGRPGGSAFRLYAVKRLV